MRMHLEDGLGRRLDQAFESEREQRIKAMRLALSELARGVPAPEHLRLLESLARHAHTLKGGAQLVGRPDIANLADAAESRLDAARALGRWDAADAESVRAAVDAMAQVRGGPPAVKPIGPTDAADRVKQASSAPSTAIVIEDDEVNRVLLRAILARAAEPRIASTKLVETASVAEGRRLLARYDADLVFLDVRLPDGSGLDLVRELRGRHPRRPAIVVMSATSREVERRAALDAGANVFLSKPLHRGTLLAAVESVMT